MKPVPLSLMRNRVRIQERAVSRDTFGAAVLSWATVATRWARIEPLSGREAWQAQQVRPDVTHRATVRYYAGLNPAHRLLDSSGAVYNVSSVLDTDSRRRQQELVLVQEVDADGGQVPAGALLDGLGAALLDGLGNVLVGG